MKKVREILYEKFKEKSDPIKDMGIGRPSRSEVIVNHYFDQALSHIRQSI